MKASMAAILELLPHGSGINGDWLLTERPGYYKAENGFQCMNEVGFYCGWADFSVIIPKGDPLGFRLHFHGPRSQWLDRRFGLREYLEDTLCQALGALPEIG